MKETSLRIIHKEDIPEGGFAGIVETRMAMNPTIWKEAAARKEISHGLGDFIYLASGYFKPNDGAPLHPHADVDIVSIILNGVVGHKGTLGDGTVIKGPGVQVQRAGTGMQHAEFSMEGTQAEIIQVWFLPPEQGLTPAYQNFTLSPGALTTVLGGSNGESFHSNMTCTVGYLDDDQSVTLNQPFIAMITEGYATANGTPVKPGDLIEGTHLNMHSEHGCGLVLIHQHPDTLS